jgi:hypothetical protein
MFMILLGTLAALTACAGARSAQTDSTGYVSQYARGDYAAAKSTALAHAQGASGVERDRANLIAGLSAAQLGQNPEATRLLAPLSTNPDREIAGRATAGMGLIARNQGDKAKGAALMAEGAGKLSGDPAAKAYLAAGDAYAELGAKDQAMGQYSAALGAAQTGDLRSTIQQRLEGKRYTVQLGAFTSRSNADKKAGEVRARAVQLGLGAPRIEQGSIRGKASYLVQVGDFASRTEAKTAMLRLGGNAVVTEVDLN